MDINSRIDTNFKLYDKTNVANTSPTISNIPLYD